MFKSLGERVMTAFSTLVLIAVNEIFYDDYFSCSSERSEREHFLHAVGFVFPYLGGVVTVSGRVPKSDILML